MLLRGGVALRERDGVGLQLRREARLVAGLQHARLPEQRADGVARLRADVEPVVGAVGLHAQPTLALAGSVLPDDLDELPVARALRVGDDDAVDRRLLATDTAETNANHVMLPGRV